MNNEWILASEKLPKESQRIWIWDGKEVEQRYFSICPSINNSYFFTHWQPLIKPEPPKKKEHRCKEYDVECFINALKELVIFSPDLGLMLVNFCPFCGYKHEKPR